MAEPRRANAAPHEFNEVTGSRPPSQHLELSDLHSVKLHVTVELGEARMLVRDLLSLKVASIVPLDKMAGELADIRANGLQIGKGEIVVIGDNLHVRVAEVEGAQDQIDEMLTGEQSA